MKNYYSNDLFDPNSWNIRGFDYALAATNRPVEMKKIWGGGLPILKYCRPPWLADEQNF